MRNYELLKSAACAVPTTVAALPEYSVSEKSLLPCPGSRAERQRCDLSLVEKAHIRLLPVGNAMTKSAF